MKRYQKEKRSKTKQNKTKQKGVVARFVVMFMFDLIQTPTQIKNINKTKKNTQTQYKNCFVLYLFLKIRKNTIVERAFPV